MRMRKKRHGSERLRALSDLLCEINASNHDEILDFSKIFGNDLPVTLEVGCGKGDFITALSAREQDKNYIAIERVSDVAVCALEKYAKSRGLGSLAPNGGWSSYDGNIYKNGDKAPFGMGMRGNVRFAVGEAGDIIGRIKDSSLGGIIANFSDPWPGKDQSHTKKRLTNPLFLENYKRVLMPSAVFSFKTDNEELFDYSLSVLPESGFEITYMTRDLHESERAKTNIVTEYEQNFTSKGIKIKMLEARPIK